MKKIRRLIFLKDVLILACTSFGGPQVHLAMFIDRFVKKRNYLSEADLLELQALCAMLPGPTSTQTITALGYKIGGPNLAYITLLVWITPAVAIMTVAAFGMTFLRNRDVILFIQPIGVALIIHAGYILGLKVIKNQTGIILMLISAIFAFYYQSPWVCPIALIIGGTFTSFNYKDYPKQTKHKMVIPWSNFNLFWGFLLFLAVMGHFTDYEPIRLFENFYRNGSLTFGGGQVLAPMLYTEFVEFKHLVRADDFLTGIALSQALPGPVFSLTSYLGVLVMRNGTWYEQLFGSMAGAAGIFLPGTFLIFFVYRIWGQLKQFRGIRASLDGINAASIGLTLAAAFTFIVPMVQRVDYLGIISVLVTLCLTQFTKIPTFFIFLGGLILGLLV
jgi:chromate transporter